MSYTSVSSPKRVLLSPLNWGIGHATRCIPVIKALQQKGIEVVVASDGEALAVLKKEFPNIEVVETPSYSVHYKSKSFLFGLFLQLPKIAMTIFREHQWLNRNIEKLNIQGIVSDNRYGMYHHSVPCCFISHQLIISVPLGKVIEKTANWLLGLYIRHFNFIWVPDYAGEPNLSGKLSHGSRWNPTFIGPLSRFERLEPKPELKWDYVAVISGPEPQRTNLENLLIKQSKELPLRGLLVLGKPKEPLKHERISETVESYSFMKGDELSRNIQAAEVVFSRSGYSTVMDLSVLGVKAGFVPTPGQTEQQYLAKLYEKQNLYPTQSQNEFNLGELLKRAKTYKGTHLKHDLNEFNRAIDAFVEAVKLSK